MSLIDGNSRFSKSVTKDISRSIFDRSNTLLTSFSAGKLVPVYVDEVLPGDTVTMDMSLLCRMATPLYPVMDNAWIDIHWFFVPNRLVWENWKYFMGETRDAWDSDVDYEVPIDLIQVTPGRLYDYFGIPTHMLGQVSAHEVSALPRRAYQLIWNEWYRDQSLQDSLLIDKGDAGISDGTGDIELLPVNKYKDYFTSALPQPQRGEDVSIPGNIPRYSAVFAGATPHSTHGFPLLIRGTGSGNLISSQGLIFNYKGVFMGSKDSVSSLLPNVEGLNDLSGESLTVTNLYSDNYDFYLGSINQLRQAFAVQRLLEADARGGTRYRELVKAHFGVDVGDSRVQVPEYLGGAHIPINVMQVVQQSSTSAEPSPLGEVGAMSKTVHQGSMFTKSFVEHGILMCLASVRTQHSYQQGINRMWNRRNRLDYYWPEIANVGEQAILNKEIYAVGNVGTTDNEVFGYQEAWADYRYRPNQITGNMRHTPSTSEGPGSLSVWHYGDYYSSLPVLSDEWVRETDENIARTLAVSDTSVFDQFLCDCYFKARWARPMPLYSIPGLSGHF